MPSGTAILLGYRQDLPASVPEKMAAPQLEIAKRNQDDEGIVG
jgi:hypothetical protein